MWTSPPNWGFTICFFFWATQHSLVPLLSSVGWFFEFLKNSQFQFFKYFRFKGPPVLVLWKELRIKEFLVLVISETSKNQGVSWKNWERTSDSLAASLKLETNLRTAVIIPKPVTWNFWESIGKWLYTQVDNWWVSVPHPKNHPTLVLSRCKRPLVHVMCLFHSFWPMLGILIRFAYVWLLQWVRPALWGHFWNKGPIWMMGRAWGGDGPQVRGLGLVW